MPGVMTYWRKENNEVKQKLNRMETDQERNVGWQKKPKLLKKEQNIV